MKEKVEYQKLTGVDIDEQRMIWDERGKGYYGEYKVFCELFNNLNGKCKLLMNLNIPIKTKTTEIDLLLLHETGIYVFEVKHYKGTIYGSEGNKIWTQYFRTSENETFSNPILQNNYHLKALSELLPDEHLESIVVFTHDDVSLKLENLSGKVLVTTLFTMVDDFENFAKKNEFRYTGTQIDELFKKLKPYSSCEEKTVDYNGEEIPFYNYIDAVREKVEDSKQQVRQKIDSLDSAIKKNEKDARRNKIILLAVIVLSMLVSVIICVSAYSGLEKSFNQMKVEYEKTYLRIDEIDDESINMAKGIAQIESVNLSKSKDFAKAVDFSCVIKNKSEKYILQLKDNSSLVVFLKNGNTFEYPLFDSYNRYSAFSANIAAGKSLYPHQYKIEKVLTKIDKSSDVSYIKVTNVRLWEMQNGLDITIDDNIDVKLYSKK